MISLRYLSSFRRALEMSLVSCEISAQLKQRENFLLVGDSAANQNQAFQINDAKLYFPVLTLPTQENIKILKQLESGFKTTIIWNKYLPKTINKV